MSRQTSIFDSFDKEDNSLDSTIDYLKAEIKNLNYLRKCLQWLHQYEVDNRVKGVAEAALSSLESCSYFLSLVGFNVEASKSMAEISKEKIDSWTNLSKMPDSLGGGEGKSYQEIWESLQGTESRVRTRMMMKSIDNMKRVDEARRMYLIFMDSFVEAKNGIGLAGLNQLK